MRTPDQAGFFGPGSVTWRLMERPESWVDGFRAACLQALHPRVMRGTWQNTAFADRREGWGRLLRTAEFVRIRTYGSRSEAERAGRRIQKSHASLAAVDSDGTRFRLDEPGLLLWVHCGEVTSYLDVARRGGMPLSGADADAFVAGPRRASAVVGQPAAGAARLPGGLLRPAA